jgi:gliding-associated putative ABC transporter substrate-binding component GldG
MRKKNLDIIEFLLWVGIVILLNIIASQYFFRVDLTEDKRYTISETSKEILKNLDDVVFVEVYLGGNLPGDYKRLENSVREMLDEFRVYSGDKLQYKFFDPNQEEDEQKKSRIFEYLRTKGITPIEVSTKEGTLHVFPAAQVVYKEKEQPVILLNTNGGVSEGEMLNQSVEGLEYQLISSIRALTLKNKKSIAFVEGHGELNSHEEHDITKTLSSFYNVYRINLKDTKSLENYDALIVAGPKTAYSDEEKYLLDQYIMKGGKVLFFMDPVIMDIDSIGQYGAVAVEYQHHLDDMLFKYGLRVNSDLVQDLQSMTMPMVVGEIQGKPQVRQIQWRYYPLLNNFGEHPTVKNLDLVLAKFIGTIDTVKSSGANKIPLVYTSKYAKKFNAPVKVDFNDARKQINPEEFNQGPYPVAFLVEGNLTSLYKNRPLPAQDLNFVAEGKNSQIFVMSDADVIKNVQERKGQQMRELPLPGGNKTLVTNVIDYMLDEQGLINVRAKEIALRPLDKVKVREDKLFMQFLNLILPVLLIIGFGILQFYIRKKKYTQFKS